MKEKLTFLIFSILTFLLISCNAVSIQNTSNDFKWKNKKFDNKFELKLDYKPTIINKIISKEPIFFDLNDSLSLDINYRIKSTLVKKLKKRNIYLTEKDEIILSVDSLVFQEYSESKSVYSNDGLEYLNDSEQDFFKFKIVGFIKSKRLAEEIVVKKEHNTDPRESYTISGIIVKDGINANAIKMIENTINEFSYRVYEKLK